MKFKIPESPNAVRAGEGPGAVVGRGMTTPHQAPCDDCGGEGDRVTFAASISKTIMLELLLAPTVTVGYFLWYLFMALSLLSSTVNLQDYMNVMKM
ncbi:hypothetical protein [Nitrosomonas sp.]|uniref:hypothetical protein n=1 Tax=Nitrosomonas sp. TaxID=42353 RepID=UPI0026168F8F|nr:hypothetical protein [Nitrosomonas sp.]MCW5601405.1 hypothetical protein [Nitrosomonas sp.]